MIRQTVLPFKIEKTEDIITAHGGIVLFGEFAIGLGLLERIDGHLPIPGTRGYKASEYIFPIILMLQGDGRSIEDIRVIREDLGLRELLRIERIPSADAIGDWFRRVGEKGGLEGLEAVNAAVIKQAIEAEKIEEYTLDIDATGIEAHKETAKKTYKGYYGYMPIVGHLAENGLIIGDEFREGNESPGSRNLEFIKHCIKQMPEGKRIKHLRADSASYQAEVINYCEDQGIEFVIGADLDKAVLKAIECIPQGEWRKYGSGYIAETVHTMNKTHKAFRLIVISRPYQMSLTGEEEPGIKYIVRATNKEGTAEEIIDWYNQRGDCSENRIKDLKIGFGMERMPCGQFEANAVFFRIGVLAYNLFRLFVAKTLDRSWHKHQVQTIRWRLYQIAGKIVYHANQISMKVARHFYKLFIDIRLKIWEFANT